MDGLDESGGGVKEGMHGMDEGAGEGKEGLHGLDEGGGSVNKEVYSAAVMNALTRTLQSVFFARSH
ncbi:hypothetical protein OUZ56_009705 [Daphnia magna]|uniref:Uncharacterized protein n=1 Tax=Daphnia magna TaxID=35525 RepID=A0ABR0AGR7_9CRUS|nr:hypothetical protein OUZ56_009705 [Daphnia magna]